MQTCLFNVYLFLCDFIILKMEQKTRSYERWTSPLYIISLIQIKFLQLLDLVGMQIKQEIGYLGQQIPGNGAIGL